MQCCNVTALCLIAAGGLLNNDIQAGLQAIVKNISSGSVKVKWVYFVNQIAYIDEVCVCFKSHCLHHLDATYNYSRRFCVSVRMCTGQNAETGPSFPTCPAGPQPQDPEGPQTQFIAMFLSL